MFDENYTQAFFEDNDFKYRAIEAGYGVFVTNEACFFHFGSVTSKTLNQNLEANRKYYYSKYPFAEYLSISGSEKAANIGATFRFGRSSESKARKIAEDRQREEARAAQAEAARQKTVAYRVEQILSEDAAQAE